MALNRDDVLAALNDLIETCRDGQEGFQNAAEHVKDAHLKQICLEYSQQRAQFLGQLQQEVQRLGGEPQQTGSIAASAHRGWINLKSSLTGGSDHAIISECERGEDVAVDRYKAALEKQLPDHVRELVETQYRQVQQAHDRVRELERSTEKAN